MTGELDGNSQKTPLAQSLHRLTQAKANDALQSLGKSLPCTVAEVVSPWIVRVNFSVQGGIATLPQRTIPVAAPPYIAYPIAQGDAGVAISASARLGGISGLGSGNPKLTDVPGNLSALMFVWLGNAAWTTIDPEAVVVMNNLIVSGDKFGAFGTPKVVQQTVTGALSSVSDPNAQDVLQSLVDALAAYGLIIDNTT